MIKILDIYIGKAILFATMICLFTLVGLSAVIKYVEQLRAVGQGTYGLGEALIYVLLKMPREITIFFPMAALLGALIGLGAMASSSELVVIQAAGQSRFKIVLSAMKTAIPMMIIVMLMGEYVAPYTEQKSAELRGEAISGQSIIRAQKGVWAKDKENFINIGKVNNGSELHNVTIYEFADSQRLVKTTQAEKAIYADKYWQLTDLRITHFERDSITVTQQAAQRWNSTLTPEKLDVVTIDPEDLSISGLYSYITYLDSNKQDADTYELAFWRKIFQPVSIGVMVLLALSFVFGPLRTVTMGARILMGVVAGFTFYLASETFGPISLVYSLPPFLGAVVPSALFTFIAVVQLRKHG
ncbi:LPS export ABC transporter permease LptG [Moritella dasanensis]|uniref:LPS export ABC transporter permease LptG n=1 Tax=Moritella dasanensis TaxID=428031 RepID=UPI0003173CA0|nr:LPS export ABC transporter permease LptG [Moritella dasanensis]